jgi:16S rRNA (cytidine1402-2'-O)-methyltransferase
VAGVLHVVSTPIGNLEDITLRALRVLKEADLVAAEDTRRTRALLTHFGIAKPLVSYHDAVEARRTPALVERLRRGARIALVTDAGTPGLSDPGHRLVAAAAAAGIAVVPVPGPSALTAALAVAALPSERFTFEGFLPTRAAARARRLAELRAEPRTLVFFEAPHRLAATLDALCAAFGDRPAVMAREVTKLHEEIRRGTLGALRDAVRAGGRVRGEVTLVVGGARGEAEAGGTAEGVDLDAALRAAVAAAGGAGRATVRDVVERVSATHGGRRREIYRRALVVLGKRAAEGE